MHVKPELGTLMADREDPVIHAGGSYKMLGQASMQSPPPQPDLLNGVMLEK